MRLDRFDLNLLVALDVLLQERNVTRAAERLYIGQAAASAALARLREYFDDELLVRVGRSLELTPLAESLAGPVSDTLQRARVAIALRSGFDPATAQRRFTVLASDYTVSVLLAEVVRELALSAPGLVLDLRSPPRDVLEVFERGGADLLVLPEQYVGRLAHPRQRLFADEHACLVCAQHPSAAGGLDIDAYFSAGHVAVRFGDDRSLAFEDWFLPRYGRQRRVECTVDSFGALAMLLPGTRRVATLHRRQAVQLARQLPVTVLPTPFEMPPIVEMMTWPRHLDSDLAHVWLRQRVLQVAATMVLGASDIRDEA